MIPKDYITAWRAQAPWMLDAQVEQDLVISRAVVELLRIPELTSGLAFRGGTALYKLYLRPPARYSEDIDLVQTRAEPIGETLDRARSVLDSWLGEPRRQIKEGRVNLVYRYDSEDEPPLRLRLKIEINTREHFTELGLVRVPFRVENPWFSGEAEAVTYPLDELLATKLRALYQRKKGRDLFDVWYALRAGCIDPTALLGCFSRYLTEEGHVVSRAQFEENLAGKRATPDFRDDVTPLLRPLVGQPVRPYRLERASARRIRSTLTELKKKHEVQLRVFTGRVRELDLDRLTLILRDVPDESGGTQLELEDEQLLETAREAHYQEFEVSIAARSSVRGGWTATAIEFGRRG